MIDDKIKKGKNKKNKQIKIDETLREDFKYMLDELMDNQKIIMN